LNQRVNRPGNLSGQNAIWQLVLDWMPVQGLRLSSNLLADEVVLDKFERDEGKPHSLAYQGRLSWSGMTTKRLAYTVFTEYTQVGTYTLRHGEGGNNFVSRGFPLGTELGSDGDRWLFGVRFVMRSRLITTISIGKKRSGEQNLLQNLYEPYSQFVDVPFPSSVVNETTFFRWEADWYPRTNIRVKIQSQIANSNHKGNRNYFLLSLDAYLPIYFEL
jgi:hypothetical protein